METSGYSLSIHADVEEATSCKIDVVKVTLKLFTPRASFTFFTTFA
jgi:hypothetical protein